MCPLFDEPYSKEDEQRDYAARHPINKKLWDKMEVISVLGAALYTFGLDPDTIMDEFEALGEPVNLSLGYLPDDLMHRVRIIKTAIQSGSISPAPPYAQDIREPDDMTEIDMKSFKSWCSKNDYNCQPFDGRLTDSPYQFDKKSEVQPVSTHDPLQTDGIARMFKLANVDFENLEKWRRYAHNASRNGLAKACTKKNGGKSQSFFDPVKVGDWLVEKSYMSRSEVDRRLNINLPPRNAHLKDFGF